MTWAQILNDILIPLGMGIGVGFFIVWVSFKVHR